MDDVEVLIATMNQDDHSILERMNINSRVIVANQCKKDLIERFTFNSFPCLFLSFAEKGVGLNRNNALMRASADYCLFADDDMVFYDGYSDIVRKAFKELPQADVLVFNIDEKRESLRRYNNSCKRVTLFNYLNYGAARFAIRRKSVSYKGIFFNQNFGGGTQHSCGEDSLFLRDCIRKQLIVFTYPVSLASLKDNRESSWFRGFNKKYFYDQGVFLGLAHPKLARLLSIYLVLKHKEYVKESGMSHTEVLANIFDGISDAKEKKYDCVRQ